MCTITLYFENAILYVADCFFEKLDMLQNVLFSENESEVFLPDGHIQLYHMFQNHLGLAFSEK